MKWKFIIVMVVALLLSGCAKNVVDKNNDLGSGDKSNLPISLTSLIEHAEYCKAIYDSGGDQKDEVAFEVKQENGISIIIVEHRLDLVLKYADRLIILSNGKIVSNDKPENVFNYKKLIIPELGIPFSTKIYRELAKAHVEFSKPVTCADDMINEVRKKS